jgi:hypothetical protein
MVRASPIEELSAFNLTAYRAAQLLNTSLPTNTPPSFTPLATFAFTSLAANATNNATAIFAGY